MKAWYFSAADKKLRYGDNREIAVGVTHEVEGDPVLCEHGLHGSIDILDALGYAPGNVVWRVGLYGKKDKGYDKIAAQKRTYLLGGIDISDVLHKFARMCAIDVVHLWDAPDIVVRYLKTGDESIRAAACAASRTNTAAWAAAEAAAAVWARAAAAAAVWARAAAAAAAEAEAEAAVWAAAEAEAAVWAMARAKAVAENAVEAAEWEKQSRRLTRMVNKEIRRRK